MAFTYDLAKFISFRDAEVCRRVASIKKGELCNHPNPDFKIRTIEDPTDFYHEFALDIVTRIVEASENGRKFVAILPVGPVPQYKLAAAMINRLRIPMDHVHIFNMDEYADQDGNTAPASWDASFQKAMNENLRADRSQAGSSREPASLPDHQEHQRLRQDDSRPGRR